MSETETNNTAATKPEEVAKEDGEAKKGTKRFSEVSIGVIQ